MSDEREAAALGDPERSPYGALRILMGAAKPTFTRGDSSGGFVIARWSHNDALMFVDSSFRVFRIQLAMESFELTKTRSLAPAVAAPLVRGALPRTP